jgi:hypothetical protein
MALKFSIVMIQVAEICFDEDSDYDPSFADIEEKIKALKMSDFKLVPRGALMSPDGEEIGKVSLDHLG